MTYEERKRAVKYMHLISHPRLFGGNAKLAEGYLSGATLLIA